MTPRQRTCQPAAKPLSPRSPPHPAATRRYPPARLDALRPGAAHRRGPPPLGRHRRRRTRRHPARHSPHHPCCPQPGTPPSPPPRREREAPPAWPADGTRQLLDALHTAGPDAGRWTCSPGAPHNRCPGTWHSTASTSSSPPAAPPRPPGRTSGRRPLPRRRGPLLAPGALRRRRPRHPPARNRPGAGGGRRLRHRRRIGPHLVRPQPRGCPVTRRRPGRPRPARGRGPGCLTGAANEADGPASTRSPKPERWTNPNQRRNRSDSQAAPLPGAIAVMRSSRQTCLLQFVHKLLDPLVGCVF